MILCLICHHQELSGALFCSECGAELTQVQQFSTHAIGQHQAERLKTDPKMGASQSGAQPTTAPNGFKISLHVIDNGQMIPLAGRSEYTLGRVAEGQPILPDIDFSTFGAYSHGVSRLHAVIKTVEDHVMVLDLGSSNGTRVNGQKITSNIDYPLKSGDILALGKLKLQVLVQH